MEAEEAATLARAETPVLAPSRDPRRRIDWCRLSARMTSGSHRDYTARRRQVPGGDVCNCRVYNGYLSSHVGVGPVQVGVLLTGNRTPMVENSFLCFTGSRQSSCHLQKTLPLQYPLWKYFRIYYRRKLTVNFKYSYD